MALSSSLLCIPGAEILNVFLKSACMTCSDFCSCLILAIKSTLSMQISSNLLTSSIYLLISFLYCLVSGKTPLKSFNCSARVFTISVVTLMSFWKVLRDLSVDITDYLLFTTVVTFPVWVDDLRLFWKLKNLFFWLGAKVFDLDGWC